MSIIIKIKTSKKFSKKQNGLLNFIKRHNPILILEKLTNRKLKRTIIIRHKFLKKEAKFKDNVIYIDFNNEVKYLWLCICHELAHIILETPPPWYKNKKINKIIKTQKDNISKYRYTFLQAIEQGLAILLQAACENKASIRKLNWQTWKTTFNYMGVKNFGEKLWEDWLKYLNNRSRYKNIDQWILEELEKYWGNKTF